MSQTKTYNDHTNGALRASIERHARYSLGQTWESLSGHDAFMAVSLAVRDRLIDRMLDTESCYNQTDDKRVYYLSMEFLMGRALGNNLANLGILDTCRQTVHDMGGNLDDILDYEQDAALGNGGLGRLAACFLDSMATLDIPGYGYGIHYEYGIFKQEIDHGYQHEKPDEWMTTGMPWLIERPAESCVIPLYGRIDHGMDRQGNYNPMWLDWKVLIGVPSDMPIVGYGSRTVNILRLYAARASQEFDIQIFNSGDYLKAVEQKMVSETISKVLYPSDSVKEGQELRLIQEYFFVACAIRDIIKRYEQGHSNFTAFPEKVAIQMNDTHPALAVAELMRLFIDERDLQWDQAWDITQAALGYTNHTLLSEALEKWSVPLFEYILPRHLQVIYEINNRFLDRVAIKWPGEHNRIRRMSIIEEGPTKQIRMAHLAIVGSHSVNGVAELHSQLIKSSLVPDFYELWPERFNNKTNGVTPRRWLLRANPLLADLITRSIGDEWVTDLDRLRGLESFADDAGFHQEFERIKRTNKQRLAQVINHTTGITVDVDSIFDVQIKRIHEYKRQLLHVMFIIHEYLALIEDGQPPPAPRTHIFAGKAAPGYWAAKQIIKLINNVAHIVNNDPATQGHLKVVFIPDYRVSLAEQIIPAANVSEQISTAGKEASGTGNMKFALNGALTIGTLDGANIEIKDEVGEDNIFIFGLTADVIRQMRNEGSYTPRAYYERYPEVKRVINALAADRFCPREPELFQWIAHSLLEEADIYFHLADLPSYTATQRRLSETFKDSRGWTQKAILNIARIGRFSSDRTIREYADEIWGLSRG